jgi:hypothetical protein
MTPEEKRKLDEIYTWMKSWENSKTISGVNDQALRDRFFGSSGFLVPTGSTGTFGTSNIVLAGSAPYSFDQPAQPSGTLLVEMGGITYELLYK